VRAISGYEYPPVDSTVVSYSSAVVIFYDVHIGIIRVPHIAQTDNNNRTNCRKLITSLGADKSNLEIKKKKKNQKSFRSNKQLWRSSPFCLGLWLLPSAD
jgi:hypothetical protein